MREYEAIADRIATDAPVTLLDWGCGWGQMSDLLRRRGVDVHPFDFRPEVNGSGLRPLARFPEIEAYIETEDPVRLPYGDAEFDAVLSCGVLEHVADPDGSLEELWRVLRPGGLFYVYKLPNRFSYLEAIARYSGMYYHGQEPDDRLYDRRSAEALLRRHGFFVGEFRRANLLPLSITGALVERAGAAIWGANRLLQRVPGLNLGATNLEFVAARR
jgi:ubiquinone/menaquinone biosynthesis C-methylase UbiE